MKKILLIIFLSKSIFVFAQNLNLDVSINNSFGSIFRTYNDNLEKKVNLRNAASYSIGFSNIHEGRSQRIRYGIQYSVSKLNDFIPITISDSILNNFNTDRYLSISRINLPIVFYKKIFNNVNLMIGYRLNYVIDKNQNFIFIEEYGPPLIVKSSFHPINHDINLGIGYKWKNIGVSIYHSLSLLPIYDTNNIKINPSYKNLKSEKLTVNVISLEINCKI